MSLDGRASSSTAIDQEQLDQRLTKLIVDHSNYRTHIIRYIRRALALCTWHIDLDYPSYFHQLEKTDKLVNLVLFIREHAMQSFQAVDRTGTLLLSQVDILLARAGSILPTAGSPLAGGMSPGKAVQLGSKISMIKIFTEGTYKVVLNILAPTVTFAQQMYSATTEYYV
ncbi:hypothetical protein BGX34_009297 [Mortierella sp. NVP85]|nr:hypothetical protein BGX34_009297 [Mortierella sp. NVP85]